MLSRTQLCVSLCLFATCFAGCKTWDKKPFDSFKNLVSSDSAEDSNGETASDSRPTKVIAIWKDATLGANGKTIRGFAGRVYFFDRNEKPVKVDGDLIVYGFDDSDEFDVNETADKKFITKAEDLAQKHSVSEVGSSYSVWLPWDEVGGYRKNISLVTMFKGTDGTVLRGEPTQNYLPGNKPEAVAEKEEFLRHFRKSVRSGVAPASYETGVAAVEDTSSDRKMQTTSISIPQGMSERLGIGTENAISGKSGNPSRFQPFDQGYDQPVDQGFSASAMEEDVMPEAARISTTLPDSSDTKHRGAFRRIPVTPIGHE